MLKLSEKVKAYVEKIEKETGYNVLIEGVNNNVGVSGTDTAMMLDHENKYIYVKIIEKEYKKDSKGEIDQEEIDSTIAHEVTHGLLSLKKKYCQLRFFPLCSKVEKQIVNILLSMIEDIVVNKIIHEKENYRPYANFYITMTKRETKAARSGKGEDFYKDRTIDPVHKDRVMAWRYIQAWGYLKYFNLDKINKKHKDIIRKFKKEFKKSYPKQYKEAEKIIKVILENDIFTPEGFYNTIKKCLDLWNLTNLVEFYTF